MGDKPKGTGIGLWIARIAEKTLETTSIRETIAALPPEQRKELRSKLIALVASELVGTVDGMVPGIAVASFLVSALIQNPNVDFDAADTPDVEELTANFEAAIAESPAEGDSVSTEQKTAVDSALAEVLKLPKSVRAAAIIILLGAAGNASWELSKYTANKGYQTMFPDTAIEEVVDPQFPIDVVVTADGLRLRAGPSFDEKILGLLPKGTALKKIEERGEWSMVVIKNPKPGIKPIGFVHNHYLQLAE